jgi:hypothetical protein
MSRPLFTLTCWCADLALVAALFLILTWSL